MFYVAQWLACQTSNPEVVGSDPSSDEYFLDSALQLIIVNAECSLVVLNLHQIHSGVCGNLYFDASYHDTTDMTADAEHLVSGNSDADRLSYLEERIEVSEVDLYEKLYTPHFDDVRENYVWHDFSRVS